MVYNREHNQIYKANERIVDVELGRRYRTEEALQGECYTDFKKRIIKEELASVMEKPNKVFPAWVRMPGESEEDFRKRLTSVRPFEDNYPAWKKAPNETKQEFKRRLVSRKVEKPLSNIS